MEEEMKGYKELDVYQRAYTMYKEIHQIALKLPSEEKYEIGSQIRRAALSIPLNIAEGYGRKDSKNEFQHFLRNAIGSCNETRVLLELLRDFRYIEQNEYQKLEEQYEVISKQLYRLRERMKTDN
jgi:four helix bundle protein